ncbi:MAG: hypothetical protein Kow0077_10700 [Anaerolineae bacterium]
MVDESQKQEAVQWIRRGLAALRGQDVKLAQRCLLKAAELDPENIDVWLYLTATTRDLTKRHALIKKALALDPQHPRALRALEEVERLLAEREVAPETASQPSPADAPEPAGEQHCPQCGAVMRYDEQRKRAVCVFCGYGTGTQILPEVKVERAFEARPWPEDVTARRCLDCEAVSLLPPGQPATTPCPVCMQPVLEKTEISVPFPDTLLTFRINEARAAIVLEDVELGGGLRRVLGGGRRQMTRPRPVLIPLWVFRGQGYARYREGDEENELVQAFDEVLIPNVRQMDERLLELAARVPFEKAEVCAPEIASDTRIYMLLPEVSLQRAAHEAFAIIRTNIRRVARQNLADVELLDAGARDLVAQLILLPAWINEIRAGGRVYMGLVNGVTGKAMAGDPPRRVRG